MKPTDYIEWDNLKDIPFFLCQVVEDREKQDLDIYYLGKRVLHDYDHATVPAFPRDRDSSFPSREQLSLILL